MKERSLSFNLYVTHGSPTLLFSWCFTLSYSCFDIQTCRTTPLQHIMLYSLNVFSCLAFIRVARYPDECVYKLYICLVLFLYLCVCVSLYICSSTHQAPGNFSCLVQCSHGEPPEGDDGGGTEETAAHFLWKWGYHFTYYSRRPADASEQAYRHTNVHSCEDMHKIISKTRCHAYKSYKISLSLRPSLLCQDHTIPYLCLSRYMCLTVSDQVFLNV